MRIFLMILLFFSARVNAAEEKKNLLILCCNGGFCHNAAAETLKNLLGDEYNFKVVYPIDELHIWGVKSGEQIYNTLLQNDWIQPVNIMSRHIAPKVFRTHKVKLEGIIQKHISDMNPDLVISLTPFINYAASEAARKSEIPYLLVTMDNDLQNWVHGLQGVQHPNFKVTVSSNLWATRSMLIKRNIPDSAIEPIGFPIRTDFTAKKDIASLKNEYGIPKNKPVALVMIGGAGGDKALKYAKHIASTQYGLHLIVCAGKNKQLAADLRKVHLHPSNTMTVMEFTTKISDLMAISDILITKPGSGTVHEAMLMKIPILADATTTVLSWEKANIDLISQYGIGDHIDNFDELEPLLRRFLFDSELQKEVKDSYNKIPANRFNEAVVPLIKSMCKKI
jgi:processive 1,2-diacylglycerol beta-glucosyltransferase